jgi:ABC-type phosphate transport system auxiliary subunit
MNETEQLQLQTSKELTTIQDNLKVFQTSAEALIITNSTQNASASDLLKRVKNYIKDIETLRTTLVKPLNDHVNNINDGFKPRTTIAKNIKDAIEKKMIDYHNAEEEKMRAELEIETKRLKAEQAALQAEAIKKNDMKKFTQSVEAGKQAEAVAAAPVKVEATVKTASGSTNFRKEWRGETTNDSLVPREYCSADTQKINAAVKAGIRTIPGVNIYEKIIPTTR